MIIERQMVEVPCKGSINGEEFEYSLLEVDSDPLIEGKRVVQRIEISEVNADKPAVVGSLG